MSNTEGRSAYAGYDRTAIDRTGQTEAFDTIGDRYDEAFPHKEGQLAAGAWMAGELPAGARVLDVGCGTGLPTARQLVQAGHRVTGIDFSPGMVSLSRRNVPGAEFHLMDLADLEEHGLGSFDGITAFFALLMLPRREIPVALRMLHGQLRPGGLLALGMVEADVDDAPVPFMGHTIRVSGYPRDELIRVVRATGFEIDGERAFSYAPASTDAAPETQVFLHCRRRP
ncbi:MAG TPA: class I SAM-dependent methyltransferase [Streptomyces sp.]|nr:class I SAM-dependent methyltransferase [Streptomyces sp.]